jgi:peroxiredoxin
LRSIEKHLGKLNELGIRPVAISVDAPDVSHDLARKAGYTFPILSDINAQAIRRYDLVHAGAGENGRDIARPAEFLVDSSGTVRWVHLTENYWVRATPEKIEEAAGKISR